MIYVDELMNCSPNKNWRWPGACHLFADTQEELHGFAERLGLKRSWFQPKKELPHYDLTPNKRKQALLLGAQSVDRNKVAEMMRKNREVLNGQSK